MRWEPYSNSCFSEYLGCQIFEIAGIPVQKTLLGTFTVNGTEKIVVACGDFTRPGLVLQDFASLKNQIIDSERNGYGTELSDILHTITAQTAIDAAQLLDRFWDMFIVDALIGNWDRHNGNWGFLYDAVSDAIPLRDIYRWYQYHSPALLPVLSGRRRCEALDGDRQDPIRCVQ